MGVGFLLAIAFGARGLVHSAGGMPDGPLRSVALTVGRTAVSTGHRIPLSWPWDQAQIALGKQSQPTTSPILLSSASRAPETSSLFGRARAFEAARWAYRHTHPPTLSSALPVLRVPTISDPLRLLVTGDSLSGYLAPDLLEQASHVGPIVGFADTHDGTGLTRPDFVDWSVVAQQQVATDDPDATVVIIGGNDFQNMVTASGRVLVAGTRPWTAEYQRRAEVCMRIWAQGGSKRIYWLSVPPARDPRWAYDDHQINVALARAAARVTGAEYVDILGPITIRGRYSDFVRISGQETLIREQDGVHLNPTGSAIAATEVMPIITREWHFGHKR